ncbi:MAG TPA: hypothetical protein VK530_07910, partial [Candidatus Acidoferrum sp.]|nr:hypothetical protein [Candidatus Acidoferrum sp.]
EPEVQQVALRVMSLWRDVRDIDQVEKLASHEFLPLARAAAELLGRSTNEQEAEILLREMSRQSSATDRTLQHSIIFALIELGNEKPLRTGLQSSDASIRRASLIALDQMPDDLLKVAEVTPLLSATNALLRETASWIVSRHSEWGAALASFFGEQLKSLSDAPSAELQAQLEKFARNKAIQALLVNTVSSGKVTAQSVALRALSRSGVKELPESWIVPLTASLQSTDRAVLASAVSLVHSAGPPKTRRDELNAALVTVAERGDVPLATRMSAAAAVSGGIRNLSEPLYSRLIGTLLRDATVMERNDAATALARARLSNARLSELAAHVKRIGPMELPKLLPAFAHSTNENVGIKLIDSLLASKAARTLRPEVFKPAITNFPPRVQQRGDEFLASLNTDAAQQKKHIDELVASVKDGDIRRGQALFNSPKAACSSCHMIGYLGGNIGPDLTRIGQIRNERDLLEAIVYPSASFVRSYEPMTVSTKSGDEFSGVLRKDSADEVLLATGPGTEQRIARDDVAEMRPGTVSTMPSGLADQLTKQEIANLLAFLRATRW